MLIATVLSNIVLGDGVSFASPAKYLPEDKVAINIEDTAGGGLTPSLAQELHQDNEDNPANQNSTNVKGKGNNESSNFRSHGINDETDMIQMSQDAQLKKNEQAINNFKILIAAAIAGIIILTGALALYRSKKIKQKKSYRKK